MKCLAMVAHPDDCIIFGWHYIQTKIEHDWHICYLTYSDSDARAKEIRNFWRTYGISTSFLGFVDTHHDLLHGKISFDTMAAKSAIVNACQGYDLILTHNINGEYGHIHHCFVHNAVPKDGHTMVYFGSDQEHNITCTTHKMYDLSLLPLHREVVANFAFRKTNYYIS